MEKMKIRCLTFLLAIAIFMPSATILATANGPEDKIKVGYFLLDGYHNVDADNGYKSGYGYEYLQNMRVYSGHEYDYIGDDEEVYFEDMFDLLERGEIDLLTFLGKTEELEERFDFSTLPIGTKSALLVVDSNNKTYRAGDYDNWDGIRIGMMENNSKNESLETLAKNKGFSYEAVYVDKEDQYSDLMETGLVDGFVASDLYYISIDEKIIAKFDNAPFYACVQKGNDKLLKEVNQAIATIHNETPFLDEKLRGKYYPQEMANQIYFTPQERAFIKQCQKDEIVFKALISPDQEPFSHYKDGTFVGSNVEITKEILARTGLEVEYIQSTTVQEYIKSIETGEADIILDYIFGFNASERYGYIPSDPYNQATVSSLSKKTGTSSNFELVALVESLDYRKSTNTKLSYSHQDIIECSNTTQTIKMVADGLVDATYLFTVVAERAVRLDAKNSMVTTGVPMESVDFTIAANQDQNVLLSSILSKASASISDKDVDAISQPYLEIEIRPITATALIYEKPIIFALLAGGFVVFWALVAIVILGYRNKAHTENLNLKLNHSLLRADKASADKSRFLAQMSHEIRTPMNAIIGFTSIAKTEAYEPEKMKSHLNKISDSSRVLLRIINDILDMSAIDGGKMKISHMPFDLKKLIYDVTTMFYQQTKTKNIDFNVHMSSVTNEILIGDELRSQQILMNLLSNAGKFTGSGGKIDLHIVETSQSQDRVHIRYILTDTGCGMSSDMQGRIFKPFEQQDATTAKKHGGSGLGLSITKSLVDLMGGTIQVTSVAGEGSQFIVDIPYTKSEEGLKTPSECFVDVRTLVIKANSDADEYTLSLLNRLLVPHDFADSLDQALEVLSTAEDEDNPYKVCLLDWNIPHIDGAEFVETMGQVFGKDGVIMMVTAYDLDEIDMEANSEFIDYFIKKPLFQSALVDALMHIIGDVQSLVRANANETFDFSGKKVLVAEDVDLNMEVAVKLLELVNVEVTQAVNGKVAAQLYEKSPDGTFDCILMDVNMPVMNGYESTNLIRSMNKPDAKTIPILAMTANAFSEDIKAALDAGMNGHIAKPVETKILYQTLEKTWLS